MKHQQITTSRMKPANPSTNPVEGTIRWSPAKSFWISFHCIVVLCLAPSCTSFPAVLVSTLLTLLTL